MNLKQFYTRISDGATEYVKIEVATYWNESLFKDNCEESEHFHCDYDKIDGDALLSATSDIMHKAYSQFVEKFGESEWQIWHDGDDAEYISFLADADKVKLDDFSPESVEIEDHTGTEEIHIYVLNSNNDINEMLFNGLNTYIEEVAKQYNIDVNALYNFTDTVAMLGMDVYIQDPTEEMLKQAEEWK